MAAGSAARTPPPGETSAVVARRAVARRAVERDPAERSMRMAVGIQRWNRRNIYHAYQHKLNLCALLLFFFPH
jgi:hypothetical protein